MDDSGQSNRVHRRRETCSFPGPVATVGIWALNLAQPDRQLDTPPNKALHLHQNLKAALKCFRGQPPDIRHVAGGKRLLHDFFAVPPKQLEAVLPWLEFPPPSSIINDSPHVCDGTYSDRQPSYSVQPEIVFAPGV